MFVQHLSSLGFAHFLPILPSSLFRTRFRSNTSLSISSSSCFPKFISTPHLYPQSMRGVTLQTLRPPLTRPRPAPVRQVFSVGPLNPHSLGSSGSSWRSFSSSTRFLMERYDRDREPPHKRKRSSEDRRARGGEEGREGGKVKDGISAKEPRHPGPTAHSRQHHHHSCRDGGGGRGRCDSIRGKNGERTTPGNTEYQQQKDRTGAPAHWWRKQSQPAGRRHSKPEAQTVKADPDKGKVPAQRPKPCPTKRSIAEQGRGAAGEQPRSGGGGGVWSSRPHSDRAGGEKKEQPAAVTILQRQWEPTLPCSTEPPPPGVSTAFDFSVMSYNILSQELLQDNAYLYRHCDPAVLQWDHRLPNLMDEIQRHSADIVCLQEVQEDHYQNQIKPALQMSGYHCEYKKRTGSKPDGCAVIFNSSRLSLISSNPVEFFRPSDSLLDRDNVGLVALLRPQGCSDPMASICVANTHLLYNPRRGDIKLAQLAILLAEIDRMSRRPDGFRCPVLLCGDLNSTPWSPLYCFLTTGSLDYRGLQMGMVSGQEVTSRGQRLLSSPLWSQRLGINPQCQYLQQRPEESRSCSPTVEGAISNLSVDDLQSRSAAAVMAERLTHSLNLRSSYQHRLVHDGRPEVTTCHSRTAQTVDYILFTPDSASAVTPSTMLSSLSSPPSGHSLQLLSRLSLVGESELEEVNGLPNRHHSSDHLPLLARFRLQL
ncbi:protein angel homolog 2 isoform X4 [Cynoglossus semilaevis]|uniref:protein angel homolog 2 isoform X4 n=1 Tax=Cynoglossus semilaevis TaxID=244447 RepID=UPI0007DC914A|nr:protein angel homolog 2-like isoform X4 [Cynoglossus semilaevis]